MTLNYSVPSMTLNSIRPEQDVIKAPGTSVRSSSIPSCSPELRSLQMFGFGNKPNLRRDLPGPVFLLFPSLPSRCVRMGAGGNGGRHRGRPSPFLNDGTADRHRGKRALDVRAPLCHPVATPSGETSAVTSEFQRDACRCCAAASVDCRQSTQTSRTGIPEGGATLPQT